MPRIDGVYARTWTNSAKANLVRQVPLIAQTYPDITRYYPATVNVRLRPMLVIAGCDRRTPPLRWKADGEDGEAGEVFDLVRCRLTIGERPPLDALLYVGHWSVHRLDPHKHEFLVDRFIDGLTDGEAVSIDIDRTLVELPYSKRTSAGVGVAEARTVVIL